MSGKPRKYVSAADLTVVQIVDLRQRWADGYRSAALARRFGVDPRYVSRIASGELRKDVTTELPRWVPLCMDYHEFQLARTPVGSNLETGTPRPCDDCDLGYYADHLRLGLCNGTPGGRENEDELGAAA